MVYIISAVWVGAVILFYYLWSAAFFRTFRSQKQRRAAFLISWLVSFAAANFQIFPGFNILITLSTFLLSSLYLYKTPWYMHLLIAVFGALVVVLCETGVFYFFASILQMSFQQVVPHKILYTLIGMTAYTVALLIAWVVYRLRAPRRDGAVSTPYMMLSLLFPMTSTISVWFVFFSNQELASQALPVFLFTLIHAAANGAVFTLLHKIETQAAQAHERELMEQQMHIQSDSIAALEKNYREQRTSVHNFQNQLQAIHDLLARGQTQAAEDYVGRLQGIQTSRIFAINSRHPTIDAVLNQKYQTAREQGIDFQARVNDLSGISISTDHLIVILSNLLDNAIEACMAAEGPKMIEFTFLKEDSLYLSLRNTSCPVEILGEEIPTTKLPRDKHGFGLPCIRNLMKELGAEYTFQYENGWFQFAAEIPSRIR